MMTRKLLIAAIGFSTLATAQVQGPFGEKYDPNPEKIECLLPAQRIEIQQQINASRQQLISEGKLSAQTNQLGAHVMFQWPVAKNPAAPYNNTWSISNYVDHNQNFPNQVQDWNCGSRTYDTSGGYNHAGIDIFTWPFSWYQMANNQSWAIAAAAGTIVYKNNGQADTSCAMSNANWNAVYVQHQDGSVAWYGHLKNNSLTTKAVGETVEAGEYLGVIGSSGNSTGPHLHFEVYTAADALVDTYSGTCNTWGAANDSWWTQQRPYLEPKVNAVFTHSAPPVFPNCPQVETLNLDNEFTVGQSVICAGYFADQNTGVPATISLYRPNGTLAYTSFATATELYYSSYWYWSFGPSTLNETGIWTVTFSLAGSQFSHQFAYGTTLASAEIDKISNINFYPNPANDRIIFNRNISKLEVISADGKKLPITFSENNADVSNLPNGIFILSGTDENGQPFRQKLVK